MTRSSRLGRILTFYSYKGGTGRSMALANLAWILAGSGKRVLAIDWDLEAPGLHRYFRPFLIDAEITSSPGLIDMIDSYASQAIKPIEVEGRTDPDWHLAYADVADYVLSINFKHFPVGGQIDLLPAGRQGDAYAMTVSSFNWQNFFDRLGGGGFFEAMRAQVRSQYDYVLIDSRTGVSDTAGICSVQMPDDLVVCFTYNNQSIQGAAAVARSAVAMRAKLATERLNASRVGTSPGARVVVDETPRPFRVFPVPMRVVRGETERLALRQAYARSAFAELVEHLEPNQLADYWREVEVPQEIFYSYEEVLAPFNDDAADPKTVLAALVRLTRYITDREVIDYRLPLAPEIRQGWLEAFAETPLTTAAKTRLAESRKESEAETLTRNADTALGRLDADERRLARRVLPRLVRIGRAEEGGGYFPIRVNLNEFSDPEKAVISKLAQAGVLIVGSEARPFSNRSNASADPSVAFADERLLRVWNTLLEWLDADSEFLIWRQRLRSYLGDWETSGRDAGALLSGRLLSEADFWTLKRKGDLSPSELDYIDASRDAAQHRPSEGPPREGVSFIKWLALAVLIVGAGWMGFRSLSSDPPGATSPNTDTVAGLIEEGNRALDSGDGKRAVAAYTRALTLDSKNVTASIQLGRSYDALGDFPSATRAYDQAVELAKSAAAYSSRGSSRALQGNYQGAVDDFNEAIKLEPTSATHLDRGVAQERLGNSKDALSDYAEAIRLDPNSPSAYLRRAQLQEKLGGRPAAIADYRRLLELTTVDSNTRTVAEVRLKGLGAASTGATTRPPSRERVIVHYNDARDAKAAEELRRRLQDELRGVSIPEPVLAKAPSGGDVRYFYREDEKLAQRVKVVAESALAKLGYRIDLQLLYRAELNRQSSSGSIELWLPASLLRPALAR